MCLVETVYKDYKHVITKSYEIYDDQPVKRLDYVKKNVPIDVYNMFLLETLQWEICILTSKRLDFNDGNLELVCIAFVETIGKIGN